jgi:hypothetical protein
MSYMCYIKASSRDNFSSLAQKPTDSEIWEKQTIFDPENVYSFDNS